MKLDLGSGHKPRAGFLGVDVRNVEGVALVVDLTKPWPWPDDSVDEACTSHFIEHLTAMQRVHFVNELYRVLKPDAVCHILVPHWSNNSAYGDLTHQWPPVAESWFKYLNKTWRNINAPHNDFYRCDFSTELGYTHATPETSQHMLEHCRDAVQDLAADIRKIAQVLTLK